MSGKHTYFTTTSKHALLADDQQIRIPAFYVSVYIYNDDDYTVRLPLYYSTTVDCSSAFFVLDASSSSVVTSVGNSTHHCFH